MEKQKKTLPKYAPEVRERAVRMVFDHAGQYSSQWEAICSIAPKIGCTGETLRKRYEAALAERQFNRVDPDNRLVAAELERRWEAALNEVRAAEEALARQSLPQGAVQTTIGKEFNDKVIRLAGRLPEIWADRQTTDAQRKALLRCLVDKVVLDRGEHDVSRVRIVWRGGAVTELEVKMRVSSIMHLAKGAEMTERVLELARAKLHDDEIASILTSEGHRSPNCVDKVLPITVQRIRLQAGVRLDEQRTRWRHPADVLSANELASLLNIPVNWIYVQIRQGRLLIDRQLNGAHLFANTSNVIESVRKLRDHSIDRLDLRINQPHQEGHQHG
jgi:transposase-like protein